MIGEQHSLKFKKLRREEEMNAVPAYNVAIRKFLSV
jgi:hypothetical protein